MRVYEKPTLLRWLYRTECDPVFSLRATVEQGARIVLGKTALDAESYAEAHTASFWNYLFTDQTEHERRGLKRTFHVVDSSARTLAWCASPNQMTSGDARRAARLKHRPAMLRMIDSLTDRQYEALSCVLMQEAGASHVHLTPSGNEGGVDFFALLPTSGRSHLFSGGIYPLRVIGQCKKYSHAVPASNCKEFLQTMSEVKHGGQPKTEAIIPPWFRTVRGPIIGCMIGHSGFQAGADTRARNHGVILADSIDVAEILALGRGLPETLCGNDRAAHCTHRVNTFLA